MRIIKFLILPFIFIACSQSNHNQLALYYDGNLSYPVKELKSDYLVDHRFAKFETNAGGSIENALKITTQDAPCDIYLTSDFSIIEREMLPEHATWNLIFAINEMVLAYSAQSKYADEISENNWWEILARPDVKFGRSDPNTDASGYRTIFVTQLTDPTFSESLLAKSGNYICPKDNDLLSLLENNTIDYCFIYKSLAIQHNINYITLPQEINLGHKEYDYAYKTAYIVIDGKEAGSKDTLFGEPIYYGLTIPKSAKNNKGAIEFLKFILSPKGQYILNKNAKMQTITPFLSPNSDVASFPIPLDH